MIDSILTGSQWSSGGNKTVVNAYIAGGETLSDGYGGSVYATVPYDEEFTAMSRAMASLEAVCNIDFRAVGSVGEADLVWASVDDYDADGALGWANPPGQGFGVDGMTSLVVINYEAYNPGGGAGMLVRGSFDYTTYIHELGHAVGLAHPHDNGGTSTVMPGVSSEFDDYGRHDFNQGIYTMMTYNDGWQTGPQRQGPGLTWGYQAGPLAFDIAALQQMYGANTSYHAGNDDYTLPGSNGIGAFYSCIWDADGLDAITGVRSLSNTIDLRAATLAAAPGGGGYVSYAEGIQGGFTIANGVVIENAIGGMRDDAITGNTAANRLFGLAGDDRLIGSAGDDMLLGGGGNDVLSGGGHNDRLIGAAGNDSMAGGNGNDRLIGGGGKDVLRGNSGNDVLRGNGGDDKLLGGGGNDQLTGHAGRDLLVGGGGSDRFVFLSRTDSLADGRRDMIIDFEQGVDLIDVAAIDANGGSAGNGAFSLDLDGSFDRGEIRQTLGNGGLLLEFNLNNDASAEMWIMLSGQTASLTEADFAL